MRLIEFSKKIVLELTRRILVRSQRDEQRNHKLKQEFSNSMCDVHTTN